MFLAGGQANKPNSPAIKGLPPDAVPPGARFDIIHPENIDKVNQKDKGGEAAQHPFLRVPGQPYSTR